MRIAVHDYAGHPFQFGLSRTLAGNGHEVRHFFFAGDAGPKGNTRVEAADPPTFSIVPVAIDGEYSKSRLLHRRNKDIEYGRAAADQIKRFKPDVILSGNTPIEAQGIMLQVAAREGTPFVFWMQDFYSLAITRLLSGRWLGLGGLIARYYRMLERSQLRKSAGVVVVSGTFKDELDHFGVSGVPVTVIPNWGALKEIPLRDRNNPWRERNGLAEHYVILYSGTLGLKHDHSLLLRLADRLADLKNIVVVVAAEGSGAAALREALEAEPRSNIVMKALQPVEVFPDMLGSGDILLALLERDADAFSVPSKVLSYLCAGRPILLSTPDKNLAAATVRDAEAGYVVSPGDDDALERHVRRLYDDRGLALDLGAAGRRYAEDHFDVEKISGRFEKALQAASERVKRASK